MTARNLLAAGVNTIATALMLDTPAQATPNNAITVTGTYQGNPQSLDYNFGSGWVQAASVAFSGGTFTFTVPAGIAAGSYTPEVRDHYAPTVTSTAGTFVVNAWTPATLATSPGAVAVFEFNANNPTVAALASDATVHSVSNSLNPAQSLSAEVATDGNGIVIANDSGADGTRRLLQFHATKISSSIYDPTADWLGAGGVNGTAGAALVDLANSTSLNSNGAFSAVIALNIDKSYTYEAGPIWGTVPSPGPLQYAQIRYNNGSGYAGAQIFDSNLVGADAQSTITAGWHVMTMIKSGATITYRLDGKQIATTTITSTRPFTASDFMIGGGFPAASSANASQENGCAPPYIGEFQAYSGVLAGTDLANAEKLAGNSIGLALSPTVPAPTIALSAPGTVQEAYVGAGVTVGESITTTNLGATVYAEVLTASGTVESTYQPVATTNGMASLSVHFARTGDLLQVVDNPTAPTVIAKSAPVTITDLATATALALDTPAQATPNTAITVTGSYQGKPQSLDYNFGSGWVQAASVTFSAGTFTFTVPAGIAAGSYTPEVRDHYAPTVTSTAGTFVVNAWTPSTLATSPGAVAVFEFNANNPTVAALASDSTIHTVLNSLNAAQSLTAEIATGGNGIIVANDSGADGTRRLLEFHATKLSGASYDPSTDWLGAGGVNGTAGAALVDLANSSDLSTNGSFSTIIALKIDKSYTYESGPIWGSPVSPGPLQYTQLRYNNGSGYAGGQVVDSSLAASAAQSTITAGWHVMTMIKSGATITYRLDGQQVATATITSTLPFTASDFMIGGGFPPTSSTSAGQEHGVPPPYIGEFQAYSGVLAGTDLANAEKLAGNAIGVALNPSVPAPVSPTPNAVVASNVAVATVASPHLAATTTPVSDDGTIQVSGTGVLLDRGPGTSFLIATGSNHDTFMLNAIGQSPITIAGWHSSTTDVLDLKRTLAGTSILPNLSNLGAYVTSKVSAGSTMLYAASPTDTAAPVLVATLAGVSTSVSQIMETHGFSLT